MKTQISYRRMLKMAKFAEQEIYEIGYCEWQSLFRLIDKLETDLITYKQTPYYSAGMYGWNCDYLRLYLADRTVIIATGYNRGFTGFKQVDFKPVEIVENKAKNLLEQIGNNELGITERLRLAYEIENLVNQVLS